MTELNLDTLRAFTELEHATSIGEAATKLGIHRTHLSRKINALERELGVSKHRLFARSSGGKKNADVPLVLTTRGQKLNRLAKDLLAMADQIKQIVSEPDILNIGFIVDPELLRVYETLLAIRERKLEVRIAESYMNSGQVKEGVLSGTLDAGFCLGDFPRQSRGLNGILLRKVKYQIAGGEALRERMSKVKHIAEFATEQFTWVAVNETSSQYELRKAKFPNEELKFTPNRCTTESMMLTHTRVDGICLVQESIASKAPGIYVWENEENDIEISLFLIYKDTKHIEQSLDFYIEVVCNTFGVSRRCGTEA